MTLPIATLDDAFWETLGEDARTMALGVAALPSLGASEAPPYPRAVVVLLPLDPQAIASIAGAPTLVYRDEYRRANALLERAAAVVASRLASEGFRAEALEATTEDYDPVTLSVPFPHKTAATLAGLGWVGKSGLLVTRRHGSAVRLATVLTDAPLEAGRPVRGSYCGACTACLGACPVGAIVGGTWRPGAPREELVDAFRCQDHTRSEDARLGLGHSICGVCIAVCPWTKAALRRAGQ